MDESGSHKVLIDGWPKAGDVVVYIRWPSRDFQCEADIEFQPDRAFYAKHLIAKPTWLLRNAARVWWFDFKSLLRGHPPRPIETLHDFNARLKDIKRFQQEDIAEHGTYVKGKDNG